MFTREYKFKFYINARHTICIDNTNTNIHPHTWEIVLHVMKNSDDFILFSTMEKRIHEYLSRYEGQLLNDVSPFDALQPTMENFGEVLASQISSILRESAWNFISLEISENPVRTYILKSASFSSQPSAEEHFSDLKLKEEPQIAKAVTKSYTEAAVVTETQEDSFQEVHSDIDNFAVEKNVQENGNRKIKVIAHYNIICLGIALSGSILLFLWLMHTGGYPWGSDSYYHLFKAQLIFNESLKGNYFPLFTDTWYNGIQPLRYWAPLPHYLIALIALFTKGDILPAYNIFIAVIFLAGAMAWILWGNVTKRYYLAAALALLWFFIPDNLRVLFSEGNISRVVVNTLFPYLLLCIHQYFENENKIYLLPISLLMLSITLSHAMIAAMVGIVVFFYCLWFGVMHKQYRKGVQAILASILGIAAGGLWLYPALKGGLVSMNSEAVGELMKGLTYPAVESINPFLRLSHPENFYFGLSILIVTIAGFVLGGKKSRAAFGLTLFIFLGTARELVAVLSKIPMSQLFWMMRFTPLAMALFSAGLLLWKGIRKQVSIVIILLVALDCMISFRLLGHDVPEPVKINMALETAVQSTNSRLALYDLGGFGSYPSYYLSKMGIKQVFGSGWQGAKTAENIMELNTALEKGWYSYLLDRSLEHGSDTLVIKKDKLKDVEAFTRLAASFGYEKLEENDLTITYKLPVEGTFGTIVKYEGLAIGKYASNLAYIFPKFMVGQSEYIDDYKVEKLEEYKVIYLSGFRYRDKAAAEQLVKEASEKGVRFIIDLTGETADFYTSRAEFLSVVAQPVMFKNGYPVLELDDKFYSPGKFPQDLSEWRTITLENLDTAGGSTEYGNQVLDFYGTKVNDNIRFIGFNLPYYTVETGDSAALNILEEITGMDSRQAPEREIVKLDVKSTRNTLNLQAEKEGVVTGLASLDTFKATNGDFTQLHNMVVMSGLELELKIGYPHLYQGLIISLAGIIGITLLYFIIPKKKYKYKYLRRRRY